MVAQADTINLSGTDLSLVQLETAQTLLKLEPCLERRQHFSRMVVLMMSPSAEGSNLRLGNGRDLVSGSTITSLTGSTIARVTVVTRSQQPGGASAITILADNAGGTNADVSFQRSHRKFDVKELAVATRSPLERPKD